MENRCQEEGDTMEYERADGGEPEKHAETDVVECEGMQDTCEIMESDSSSPVYRLYYSIIE